jgi:hypothetical protein
MYIKKISLFGIVAFLSGVIAFLPLHAEVLSDEAQIAVVISKTYDKPNNKVSTSPVSVADDFAIADWTQGERGGRALMKKIKGNWEILACGNDGLKDTKSLVKAGMSEKTASMIVKKLADLEKSEDPKRLAKFNLFGTPNDPINKTDDDPHKHHHYHH